MGRLGVGDRLNQNSRQGIIFTEEYRKIKLDPRTLIPSEHNKYAQEDIEELADNMLLVGAATGSYSRTGSGTGQNYSRA